MALEIPSRTLQANSPVASMRASYESTNPHTPLSPVAQSIEQKNSQPSLTETQGQPSTSATEPQQEEIQPERPSLNHNRQSWRSARPQSWAPSEREDRRTYSGWAPNDREDRRTHSGWAPNDREDRRTYTAVESHDYGVLGKPSMSKEYAEPPYDHRGPYYDHPYHPYPYHGPPRQTPPRASWRSSATVGRPASTASRAPQPVKGQSGEATDDESEAEEEHPPPRPKTRQLQQRPLTWGYGGETPPPMPPAEVVMRLPFSDWMNSGLKEHFVAFLSEFVGTVMFLFFAFAGTQVANVEADNPSEAATTTGASTGFSPIVLTYISLSFGFSLMVNVWIFYRISGGLFNPAVTLGMVMVKSLSYTRGALLVVAQITGSMITSLIVKALFPVDFNVRTTLSPGTSLIQGVFIEGLLTAELVFAIFMLAKEKHRATYLAPIGIGIAMFVAELVGVYYTGGSLNPARSFGPCVVTGIWDKEHWIYWVGPACGAIGAVGFYNFIKVLEYEMANPGQDSTSEGRAAREAKAQKEKKDDESSAMV